MCMDSNIESNHIPALSKMSIQSTPIPNLTTILSTHRLSSSSCQPTFVASAQRSASIPLFALYHFTVPPLISHLSLGPPSRLVKMSSNILLGQKALVSKGTDLFALMAREIHRRGDSIRPLPTIAPNYTIGLEPSSQISIDSGMIRHCSLSSSVL